MKVRPHKEDRFKSAIWSKFFTMRIMWHWNSLSGEVVDDYSIPGRIQGQVGWASE